MCATGLNVCARACLCVCVCVRVHAYPQVLRHKYGGERRPLIPDKVFYLCEGGYPKQIPSKQSRKLATRSAPHPVATDDKTCLRTSRGRCAHFPGRTLSVKRSQAWCGDTVLWKQRHRLIKHIFSSYVRYSLKPHNFSQQQGLPPANPAMQEPLAPF